MVHRPRIRGDTGEERTTGGRAATGMAALRHLRRPVRSSALLDARAGADLAFQLPP